MPTAMGKRARRSLVALAALVGSVPALTAAPRVAAALPVDAPAWCGAALAAPMDGGLVLDDGKHARSVAARDTFLFAWSPDCSRVAAIGDRVRVIVAGTGAVQDLGPLPPSFAAARKLPWLQPSVVWSPSGARFAAVFGGKLRGSDGVVLFEAGGPSRTELALPRGEITALSLLDEGTAVVAVHPGGMDAPVSSAARHRQRSRSAPAASSASPSRRRRCRWSPSAAPMSSSR